MHEVHNMNMDMYMSIVVAALRMLPFICCVIVCEYVMMHQLQKE